MRTYPLSGQAFLSLSVRVPLTSLSCPTSITFPRLDVFATCTPCIRPRSASNKTQNSERTPLIGNNGSSSRQNGGAAERGAADSDRQHTYHVSLASFVAGL